MGINLGIKNPKGSVTIENFRGRIRLRWRFLGKRYSLNLSKWDELNLLQARKFAIQIEQDLLLNHFDGSLERYKQTPKKVTPVVNKSTIEWFEEWAKDYKQIDLDVNVHYYGVRGMLKRWKLFAYDQMLEKLNKEPLGAQTYNERLVILNQFSQWMVKKTLWKSNPLEGVSKRKIQKTDKSNRKPLTLEEITLILEAFKTDKFCKNPNYKHSHYYPFLYFIFQTGVRNAEAVGLRVGHIDLKKNMIHIKEVLARSIKGTNANARVRKSTKNGKERYLPVSIELLNVLAPLVNKKQPDDLVFTSPKGVAIDDRMFQRRIFKPVLKELGIEDRVLYACRHTFGSRCIDAGINPVMTAFLMGNNPETALKRYTHQITIPKELPNI
jgi:integrase